MDEHDDHDAAFAALEAAWRERERSERHVEGAQLLESALDRLGEPLDGLQRIEAELRMGRQSSLETASALRAIMWWLRLIALVLVFELLRQLTR
jgi:hypothetical protein